MLFVANPALLLLHILWPFLFFFSSTFRRWKLVTFENYLCFSFHGICHLTIVHRNSFFYKTYQKFYLFCFDIIINLLRLKECAFGIYTGLPQQKAKFAQYLGKLQTLKNCFSFWRKCLSIGIGGIWGRYDYILIYKLLFLLLYA